MVDEYIDNNPNGKLYLRGIVELIPELTGDIEEKRWNYILSLWKTYVEIIAQINEMEINDFDISEEIDSMFPVPNVESLWKLAGLIVDTVEAQILCLKAENVEVICSIIEANIQDKLTTVRLFRQSNE